MDLLPNPNEDVKSAAQFANELRQKLEARERELEAATARIQGLEKLTAALGARRTLQPGARPEDHQPHARAGRRAHRHAP